VIVRTSCWTADRRRVRDSTAVADTTKDWDRKDVINKRGHGGSTTSNSNRSRPTRGRTRSQCRTQEQTVNQLLDQDLDQWDQCVRIS